MNVDALLAAAQGGDIAQGALLGGLSARGNGLLNYYAGALVNLQFSFFSVPICSRRMFMQSITLIIALIARLFSLSEKKLLKSEIIVVPLLTASEFELYSLAIIKLLIFSELSKLRSHFHSYFMLNYAGVPSLAKL